MSQPLILLTTDFSPESARAYQPAVELAERLGAGILLLHVVELAGVAPHGAPLAPVQQPPDTEERVATAERSLAAEVARLGDRVPTQARVAQGTDTVDTIVKTAREAGASYIALSTHGRTGLRRLVLGSVAEAVVRHAKVPVICFPGH
jgi:nucleotide-binding universal stress UspA family protein